METHRSIPNRLQPSRFVVLRRSKIWKYATGELDPCAGSPVGIVSSTFSTVHGPLIVGFGLGMWATSGRNGERVTFKVVADLLAKRTRHGRAVGQETVGAVFLGALRHLYCVFPG